MLNLNKIKYEFNRINLENLFRDLENNDILLPNKFKVYIYNDDKIQKLKEDIENGLYVVDIIIVSKDGYNWLIGGIDIIINLYLLWRGLKVLTKTKVLNTIDCNLKYNFEINKNCNILSNNLNFTLQVNTHWYFSSEIESILNWLQDRNLKLVRGIKTLDLKSTNSRRERWVELEI